MLQALEHGANSLSLLVYGSSLSDTDAYVKALRNQGLAVHADAATGLKQLAERLEGNYDFFLVNCDKAGEQCTTVLEQLRQASDTTPLLLITAEIEDKLALAKEFGARDLIAPKDEKRLQFVMQREFRDLLLRRETERLQAKLTETEQRCATLIHSSQDAIAYVHEGMHMGANPVYLKMFGFEDESELEGLPLMDLVAPEERPRFKTVLRKLSGDDTADSMEVGCVGGDGHTFRARMEFSPSQYDEEPCTQIVIRDQSQFQHLEDRIRELSSHDAQTGLYNKTYLMERLESQVARLDEGHPPLYLLLLTVSNCADICRDHGMELSESLLDRFSTRLRELCEDLGTLARFGDHDFALLMNSDADPEAAARDLLEGLAEIEGENNLEPVKPVISIGLAQSHQPLVISASDFVNRALRVRHEAETEGGNRFVAYQASLPEEAESSFNADISQLVEKALQEDQFKLLYQPIVSLEGDARENYAVLLRLVNEQGDLLLPADFMESARESGNMVAVDHWVIRHALMELTKHREAGRKVNFFVNLSLDSLQDEGLLLWLCDRLREYRAKGAWLTIQIRKRDIRSNLQAARDTIEGLKKINCRVAIDHFDTGPSSDTLLKHLPIDIVKLKPDLLEGIAGNADKQDELTEINTALQARGVKTVAVEVEDANTLAVLWNVSVNYIQGDFVQKPSESIEVDEEA
jgi:diguanylate cyclase (GGDEF)-like protein/PAS domain S-box-containing protein